MVVAALASKDEQGEEHLPTERSWASTVEVSPRSTSRGDDEA
jgi:DNA-binding transcriptional regulator YhcF (GntR family)